MVFCTSTTFDTDVPSTYATLLHYLDIHLACCLSITCATGGIRYNTLFLGKSYPLDHKCKQQNQAHNIHALRMPKQQSAE